MAPGQLRDCRRGESASLHALQSLSAPLPRAETGPSQCCIIRKTHPLHLHGASHSAPGNQVCQHWSAVPTFSNVNEGSITLGHYAPCSECRGNSKYHHYGIRVKPDSPLNQLQEDMQYMALRQQPVQHKQRYFILLFSCLM